MNQALSEGEALHKLTLMLIGRVRHYSALTIYAFVDTAMVKLFSRGGCSLADQMPHEERIFLS